MKLISIMIMNLKNLLPYFLLIAIYFFFINLEARQDKNQTQYSLKESILQDEETKINSKAIRITIPVIPYNQ